MCTLWRSRTASACASSLPIPRLSRSTCVIWWPTRMTGFSASRGFWKIIEISLPRTCASRVGSESVRRSRPRQSTSPPITRPGFFSRPMIEAAVTDFPEPVSPTSPTTSPSSISRSMPSITRSSPLRMKNEVRRSLTSSSATLRAPASWVEDVLEPVSEQVEAEDREGDRQAREGVDPPVTVEEVLEAHADHHAPLGPRDAHAETDEREARRLEDRPAALERRDDDDGHERVREQVPPQQAKARVADRDRGQRVLALLRRQHQVPHQPRVPGNVDRSRRDDHGEDAGAHRPGDGHGEDEAWERLEHVLRAHQRLVDPAAEEPRHGADEHADRHRERDCREGDDQVEPCSDQDACEDVVAELVGAERMRPRRSDRRVV